MEQITLPAGTIVKVNGMPFRLVQDTPIEGQPENFQATSPVADVQSGSPAADPQRNEGGA